MELTSAEHLVGLMEECLVEKRDWTKVGAKVVMKGMLLVVSLVRQLVDLKVA